MEKINNKTSSYHPRLATESGGWSWGGGVQEGRERGGGGAKQLEDRN